MKFLTANWKDLVMCNWQVKPALLDPYLPVGTELDLFEGKAFVSLVAFRFLNTRILGVPIPWHINFDEINLRFYVKRYCNGELRRGVVFIQEYVPRFWIAAIARSLYNENYFAGPTRSGISDSPEVRTLCYNWGRGDAEVKAASPRKFFGLYKRKSFLNNLEVKVSIDLSPLIEGSIEEFVAQHYFGYAKQRDGGTIEYRVTHPRWMMRVVQDVRLAGNFEVMYGRKFAKILSSSPDSCFVAEGSEVEVDFGYRIKTN